MCFPTTLQPLKCYKIANAVCACTCVYRTAVWTQLELIHVVFDLDYPSLQGTGLVFRLLIPKPGYFFFPFTFSLPLFLPQMNFFGFFLIRLLEGFGVLVFIF